MELHDIKLVLNALNELAMVEIRWDQVAIQAVKGGLDLSIEVDKSHLPGERDEWREMKLLALTIQHLVSDEARGWTSDIYRVERFVSRSGNTSWKAYDAEDNQIIYLRQAHQAMLETFGLWDKLNSMSDGDEWNVHDAQITWVMEGDFRKPVSIDGIWEMDGHLAYPEPDPTPEPDLTYPQQDVIDWAYGVFTDGDFVVLDTETTGLKGYPIQVAVIDPAGKTLFDHLVKPPEGVEIEPGAQKVHGITLDELADQPTWDKLVSQFDDAIAGKHVLIYNANFDSAVLERVMSRYDYGVTFAEIPSQVSCVMEKYAEFVGDWSEYHQSYIWLKLVEAASREGVPVADAHSALGDCHMTLGVLKALAAKKAIPKATDPNVEQPPF